MVERSTQKILKPIEHHPAFGVAKELLQIRGVSQIWSLPVGKSASASSPAVRSCCHTAEDFGDCCSLPVPPDE